MKQKDGQNRSAQELTGLLARFRDGLADGTMTADEAMKIIEKVQASGGAAIRQVAEMLGSSDKETRYAGLMLARELQDRRLVVPLRRVLRDPRCDEEEKLLAAAVLAYSGAPVDDATLRQAIPDIEGALRASLEHLLSTIEDPVHVAALLEMMGRWPPEMQSEYVHMFLGPSADRRLLLLLNALLYSTHDEVVAAAIEAIEHLSEPATIPLLEERASYDPSPRVRLAAANAALRLKERVGEIPPAASALPPWSVRSDLPLACCFLSTIDGSGGQVLFVGRLLAEGTIRLVDVMFNDHEGIKDCFSGVVSEENLDEIKSTFGDIGFVDISLERAREKIAQVVQVTLEAHRRLPALFPVWRGWLEGSEARPPEEFPLPAVDPSMRDKLLADCAGLLELDEFQYWFFNPDEVEAFLPAYRRLLRRHQAEAGKPAFEALIDRAVETVVDERYRRLLPKRLRDQAWLLRQIYEDDEVEVSLWALVAADAIEEGIVVQHPLLREMMIYSLANAAGF